MIQDSSSGRLPRCRIRESARGRTQLIDRLKAARMNFQVALAQFANSLGHEAEEQVVARKEVEIDGADGDLGLARDHLDCRALDALGRKHLRGSGKDGLTPGHALAFFALADA